MDASYKNWYMIKDCFSPFTSLDDMSRVPTEATLTPASGGKYVLLFRHSAGNIPNQLVSLHV